MQGAFLCRRRLAFSKRFDYNKLIMWGLLVGIIIGMLQVLGLSVFGKMILGKNNAKRVLGAVALVAKLALIILLICLISTVSLDCVIWTAGGMLLGLILSWVYVSKRSHMKDSKDREYTAGKDNSNV